MVAVGRWEQAGGSTRVDIVQLMFVDVLFARKLVVKYRMPPRIRIYYNGMYRYMYNRMLPGFVQGLSITYNIIEFSFLREFHVVPYELGMIVSMLQDNLSLTFTVRLELDESSAACLRASACSRRIVSSTLIE